MRAILIDATARTVVETDIKGELADFQKAVGGYIEVAHRFDNGDILFVNEEGLFDAEVFFDIGAHQPFAGNGIISGGEDANGDSTAALSDLADIQAILTFS